MSEKQKEKMEEKEEMEQTLKENTKAKRKKKHKAFLLPGICLLVFVLLLFTAESLAVSLNKAFSFIKMVKLDFMIPLKLIMLITGLYILNAVIQLGLKKWSPESNQLKTFRTLSQSAMKYLLAIFGIFRGLAIMGVDVGALLAGAGIAALVIGFGAESLIADVVTGIFMLFEHEYEVGDIIVVGDFRGTVKEIGIRTTSIEDVGGNIKIINNSDVRNLINRSHNHSKAICDIAIPPRGYLQKAEATIAQVIPGFVKENEEIFTEDPVYMGVQHLDFQSEATILRISAKVNEKDIFTAQRIMNRTFLMAFEKAGIAAPDPENTFSERTEQ